MDFTREPIIESVITPKEGCKLVVRSSKAANQEEFFVDSLEVVSFGHSLYYRSQERPKSFLVPANDYEILEVRETRIVLKNVGIERSTIKIGGGREASRKEPKEEVPAAEPAAASDDQRGDKKRDKRRHSRRRRSKGDIAATEDTVKEVEEEEVPLVDESGEEKVSPPPRTGRSTLLPPPSTLISETIARYKDNALFKDAFFLKDEDELGLEEEEQGIPEEVNYIEQTVIEEFTPVGLPQPEYGSFELTEEEEEEIYRQRQKYKAPSDDKDALPEIEDEEPPKISEDLIGDASDKSKGNYNP